MSGGGTEKQSLQLLPPHTWLAALVQSSDDAIISKTLDGIITTWNSAAERILGYSAAEAVGRSITMLLPPERLEEEVRILSRLRRGERIDHFETVRVTRDGRRLDVSINDFRSQRFR
jgi:PAS domain S-box-containing protein